MTSKSLTGVCDSSVSSGVRDFELGLHFLLPRQKCALADDVVQVVEEAVDRLQAEAGHADVIRIRKNERDAKPAGVRLAHVANFAGEHVARASAVLPVLH